MPLADAKFFSTEEVGRDRGDQRTQMTGLAGKLTDGPFFVSDDRTIGFVQLITTGIHFLSPSLPA